jgi:hypothetical protein
MFSFSRLLAGLAAALLLSVGAASAAVTAEVVELKGEAGSSTQMKGPFQALQKGQKLSENTFVRTGRGSSVVLKFENSSAITVHELSQIYLKTLAAEPQGGGNLVYLLVGKLWSKVKKMEPGGKGSFTVQTPAAIAAVRGTEWFIESNATTNNSLIGVWEGTVEVTAIKDPEFKAGVKVNAGFQIEVLFNTPPDPKKLLQLEQARERERQQLNQQLDSLGLTNILGAGAVEMAKLDAERTEGARQEVLAANALQRATKKATEDVEKLKRALAKLHQDTQFLPGEGLRKTSNKETSLRCLIENNNGKGQPIPNWKGPYLESNLMDPWGSTYGVYQRAAGGKVQGLVLHSNGADKGRGNDDDFESYISLPNLTKLAGEP